MQNFKFFFFSVFKYAIEEIFFLCGHFQSFDNFFQIFTIGLQVSYKDFLDLHVVLAIVGREVILKQVEKYFGDN